MKYFATLTVSLYLCISPLFAQLESKEGILNKPFLEWEIQYPDYSGNPWDIEAFASFSHPSGKSYKSLIFYSGDGNTWKFRFTGTETGTWHIKTQGPGELGGKEGKVVIKSSAGNTQNGFIVPRGNHWRWEGSDQVFIPQLVMAGEPDAYWQDGQCNQDKINFIVERFLQKNKFTGLHIQVAGRWFDINRGNTSVEEGYIMGPQNPDVRTFTVLEKILLKLNEHNGMLHFWMWGADAWGYPDQGPFGVGGQDSETSKRIFRYIAARLGALPNWSMGYGWDLEEWTTPEQLTIWKNNMEDYLGGWPHMLGGRAHHRGDPPDNAFWSGDYTGYTSFRPDYDTYLASLKHNPDKPSFQEDRFRIRIKDQFFFKDYTPEMLIRGLWHSTLAGGVANIWGNLTAGPGNNLSAGFNDNGIMITEQINTYYEFFFGKERFSEELMPANQLTDYKKGVQIARNGGGSLNVCSKSPDNKKYIFYKENSEQIRMDLSGMNGKQKGVAIDINKPYQEIEIGILEPEELNWEAPYESDWAIAIGEF